MLGNVIARRSVPMDERELMPLCPKWDQERGSGKEEAGLVELVLVSRSIQVSHLYTTSYSVI